MFSSSRLPPSVYSHEHQSVPDKRLDELKAAVDTHNLTDIWNMILNLDYHVNDVRALRRETRDEFCDIMDLLLKAFVK